MLIRTSHDPVESHNLYWLCYKSDWLSDNFAKAAYQCHDILMIHRSMRQDSGLLADVAGGRAWLVCSKRCCFGERARVPLHSSYFVPTTITSFHFVISCRKSRCSLAKTESGIIESKDSFGETKDGALPDYSSSISTLPPNISFWWTFSSNHFQILRYNVKSILG